MIFKNNKGGLIIISDFVYIGKKIIKERRRRGWSQKVLCDKADVSPSLLSQIENGKINPSLKSLDKIASAFSIHISKLFIDYNRNEHSMHFTKDDHMIINDEGKRTLELLMPEMESMKTVLLTLKPKAIDHDYTKHSGIEFVYVFQGEIQVIFQEFNEKHKCSAGQTIVYHAISPHKLINLSDKTAKCFIVNLPKTDNINLNS